MHPLNMAAAFQIMSNIKNGQLRHCLAMGFDEKDLSTLSDPRYMGALANSPVPWFKLLIDGEVVHRLLAHVRDGDEEALISRAISLGASASMIQELFGLPPKEVAVRRNMLGLEYRKGRWPLIGHEEEMRLWNHWQRISKEQGTDIQNPHSMLHAAMLMTECEPALNLTMVWTQVQRWMADDLL
ncbi:STY4526/YPO1902 family pathogenicity island replication protein [Pseudomonas vanderleydeniana]|uniref:DUF2857 domain-containing protein n=1 Tax=Pseudomonas vanderleydeniana TaxID=2745495 RepID=A0A9E6PGW3_9PSED|nr:STY4526/YPO1902 family pathogenicity island replication protein [Pseudomonas vanderleydeniana]QXI26253.1 DUF2857 domain-containing protein [Pseudomonas vanderleydeniana]